MSKRYLSSSRWSNDQRPPKTIGVTDEELELIRQAMRLIRGSSPDVRDVELASSILVEIDETERTAYYRGEDLPSFRPLDI